MRLIWKRSWSGELEPFRLGTAFALSAKLVSPCHTDDTISGLPAAEITCELFEIALGDIKEGLPYEALSYTWGSPQAYLEKENKNKKIICHPPDDTRQVI